LIRRTTRQLEKSSQPLGEFGHSLRANLNGAVLQEISKDDSERVVRFRFERQEETGETRETTLVAQLTGRSANLLLLNELEAITHSQRALQGLGQQAGDRYQLPKSDAKTPVNKASFEKGEFESLSAAADSFYQAVDLQRLFDTDAALARNQLRQELMKLEKLGKRLQGDLTSHGDADEHKKIGDLLLANISDAQRLGNKVRLKDFYSADAPVIEIEIDEKTSLQSEAAKYFARYGKAKRAAKEISQRLRDVEEKISSAHARQLELERIIQESDEAALGEWLRPTNNEKKPRSTQKTEKKAERIPGVRRYRSSDDYEVLVGRAAKDNDNLTFRIARSQDLWLHAADYPGSHVVVRNQKRKEIPHRTVIEAAQLAAKFSQAGSDSKVNVNYTQQKFVSRIKG